jgi:aryl-alcohol dehydrogenase-like predicted oxidoreductase
MEQRTFGKTGMQVSVLGFGGSEIGYEHASAQTVERLLNGALDAGLNVIDTAECYETSEELIGKTVAHRRHEYYLFTKCGHAAGFRLPDWHPNLVEKTIERSLRRLGTDYLDLVQLHSCSERELRRGEVISALQRMRDAGKTRYIGYSGDSSAALYAIRCGAFDALQISVNIADQEAIDDILPAAIKEDLGIIAKRPLANAVWRHNQTPGNWYVRTYWKRLQALEYDFLKDGEEAAGIALGFALTVPGVHTAIVGTADPSRWQQNAALIRDGPLPAAQYEAIRARWRAIAKNDWTGQE